MQLIGFLEQLKKYSYNSYTKNDNKKIIDVYETSNEQFSFLVLSYLLSDNKYETYLSVTYNNEVVSCLLYAINSNKEQNKKHFRYLKKIVERSSIIDILKECKKQWHNLGTFYTLNFN